jgi:tetratricopeptide (TPR) repeat protein
MKFIITILAIIIFTHPVFALKTGKIQSSYYKSYNYEKMGNYNDAIKALQIVYSKFPKGYTLNFRLGYLYFLNKNYTNSITHYKKAIQSAPYSVEPKLGLMSVLIAKSSYEKAEEIGLQVLNADYYNYYGNLRLAYILRLENKLELAEKILLKMLGLYPIDVPFLTQYGILKYINKKYSEATQIFYDILILDPENVTANEYILLLEKNQKTK